LLVCSLIRLLGIRAYLYKIRVKVLVEYYNSSYIIAR